jgi:glycine cleavage system H protein
MSEIRFTAEHEWLKVDASGIGTVGISDYAQQQLGDIVFVELPAIGRAFTKGEEAAVVESVKAASEVYAPVAGEVVEVNTALAENPALVNTSPLAEGWFFRLKLANPADAAALMDEAAYAKHVAEAS